MEIHMSKQEWKNSGTELGHAFKSFGKTFVRSAKTTGEKIADWADDKPAEEQQPESTVYSDGSWKQTGKELGNAFVGVGKTLLHTVGIGGSNQNQQSGETTDGENATGGSVSASEDKTQL